MKIKSIEIKNYKSIKEEKIENLGDFNVFIGKNDAGKSNVLRALDLFFNWSESGDYKDVFKGGGSNDLQFEISMKDYRLFFGQKPGTMEMSVYLGLTKEEINELFQGLTIGFVGEPRQFLKSDLIGNVIVISMQIIGDRKIATGRINYIKTDKGIDLVKWDSKKHSILRKTEAGYSLGGDKGESIGVLPLAMMRRNFFMIPAVRNIEKEDKVADKPLPDGKHMPSEYFRYEKNKTVDKRYLFHKIKDDMRKIHPEYAEIESMEEATKEIDLHFEDFPSSSVGDGVKQTFVNIFNLNSCEAEILSIEEPEVHLHPEAERKLFDYLKKKSKEKQIFIATHSPTFIDKTNIKNMYLVTKKKDEGTRVKQINANEGYEILDELGFKLSDVLQSDAVVFTEGPSDALIWREFMSTCSQDPDKLNTVILNLGGGNARHIVVDDLVKLNRKFIVVLDSEKEDNDTEIEPWRLELKAKCESAGKKCFIIEKVKSIENYFSVRAIAEVLQLQEASIELDDFKRIEDVIKEAARKEGKSINYNKVKHGKKIAEAMTKDEIDKEIGNIISKIVKLAK